MVVFSKGKIEIDNLSVKPVTEIKVEEVTKMEDYTGYVKSVMEKSNKFQLNVTSFDTKMDFIIGIFSNILFCLNARFVHHNQIVTNCHNFFDTLDSFEYKFDSFMNQLDVKILFYFYFFYFIFRLFYFSFF